MEDKQRSKEIDQTIKKDRKYIDHEIKILLLGAGESGKSTYEIERYFFLLSPFSHFPLSRIVKQMRILFDQGFTEDDRQTYKEIISSNIILSMRCGQRALSCLFYPLPHQPTDRLSWVYKNYQSNSRQSTQVLWNCLHRTQHYSNRFWKVFGGKEETQYFFVECDRGNRASGHEALGRRKH